METLKCEFCEKIMTSEEHHISDICGECSEENLTDEEIVGPLLENFMNGNNSKNI